MKMLILGIQKYKKNTQIQRTKNLLLDPPKVRTAVPEDIDH